MFWLDRVFNEAEESLKEKMASGKTLVIRDEKTLSGRVHVGSMRALALHAAIAERLEEAGVQHVFKFELNDFDPMDGLPVYLDESVYKEHMGKPLFRIPSPDPSRAPNFAEYFGKEFVDAVHEAQFFPEFYRASELYLSGAMNEPIRLALERAPLVRRIYKEIYGMARPDDWYPLSVVCESCGKIGTTKVISFDGVKVNYTCEKRMVEWAEGCLHAGSISPFDGNAKLPWKLDWAAKWKVVGVDIEGGGKDHYSKGGSRDVARRISEEVFEYPEPFGVPNEFFLVGGKKMSSSKGEGSAAGDIVRLVPPRILRLALFQKDINQQINFDPSGDTVPVLFDAYDRLTEKYFSGVSDDDTRLFLYAHPPEERADIRKRFLPRFSQVAFLVQMPHLDFFEEIEKLKGTPLTNDDKDEAELRATYARRWLERTADDEYKFTLAENAVPPSARSLSSEQKEVLGHVLHYIEVNEIIDGQKLHTTLHDIRKRSGLEPKEFFGALYLSFLGKDHGPKAGWFLSVLSRDFVIKRLQDVM